MKIKSLQISNVLTFKYVDDIDQAEKISFDRNFNILIGQNGAGKSTVLEVVNFILRRVLFVPYNRDRDLYTQRATINADQKRQIISKISDYQYYRDFRLDRNYDFENSAQKIRAIVEVDDIDRANISLLLSNKAAVASVIGVYSAEQMLVSGECQNEYQIDINLDSTNKTYSVDVLEDTGYYYLAAYNLYKEIIEIYNEENPQNQIVNLAESFVLIGGYRNYSSYIPYISLGGGDTASKQIQNIKTTEYSKSTNTSESGEPSVFGLVRLRMAEHCFNLIVTNKSLKECEAAANDLPFIRKINEKLQNIHIKIEVSLRDHSRWDFAFSFVDTKRNRIISDLRTLSAGQKAIAHLVFEAYGRGDLKGGLVIIDEPEIHLHYQLQNEYLRIIKQLNSEQKCQYILVTHSESLINSDTVDSLIRLSLDAQGYTKINQPNISTNQKWLVKILDNTRSIHAFFGSKVLLVEGESDRYFFRAVLGEIEEKLSSGIVQDITVLDINDKKKDGEWRGFFESFGLKTFFISDLDYAWKFYPTEAQTKVNNPALVSQFSINHPDVTAKIEAEYTNGTFVLKEGDLEIYLGIQKDLSHVINFCQENIKTYLAKDSDTKVQEIKNILSMISGVAV